MKELDIKEKIRTEMIGFKTVHKGVIEVEFDDYVIEIDPKELERLGVTEVNEDTLTEFIFKERYVNTYEQ